MFRALALAALMATPIQAQDMPCASYEETVDAIGEIAQPIWRGFQPDNMMLEIWQSEDGNFVVLVINMSTGRTCVPAHGFGGQMLSALTPSALGIPA